VQLSPSPPPLSSEPKELEDGTKGIRKHFRNDYESPLVKFVPRSSFDLQRSSKDFCGSWHVRDKYWKCLQWLLPSFCTDKGDFWGKLSCFVYFFLHISNFLVFIFDDKGWRTKSFLGFAFGVCALRGVKNRKFTKCYNFPPGRPFVLWHCFLARQAPKKTEFDGTTR